MKAEELDCVLERYVSAVCPISIRYPSGVVDALGSGVFITLGGYKFLLTAAHVTDRAATGDLVVSGRERAIYLEGFHASGRLPSSGNRDDDAHDIAYFRLQEPFVAQLNPFFTFLDIDDLDLFDTTKPGDVYSMIGFPGGEPSVAGEPISRERFTFTADARDAKFYRKHGYDIDHHILLHFHLQKIKRLGATSYLRSRHRDSAPQPDGMSGCAVVALSNPNPASHDTLSASRLAGILTTYHPSEHSFAATRINCFIHCILKNYPDIPVTYAGSFTHNRNG
jgi:hypothetical protein